MVLPLLLPAPTALVSLDRIISDGVVNGIERRGNVPILSTPIYDFHKVIGSLPTTIPTPSLVKASFSGTSVN